MNTFNNFLEAESLAQQIAENSIKEGYELAFMFINARKMGNPYSESEMNEARYIYFQAVRAAKRHLIESWIKVGAIRECVFSRRFMANLPIC